jgi:dipeptidyl aminopeptidase/acylaminoacyl peptidase
MRMIFRSALLLLAAAGLAAQEPTVPVPPSVKAERLPPIPERIAQRLAPYSQFGRASFLSWHPTRKHLLITTAAGGATQVHVVDRPGGIPAALTAAKEGVTGPAWYVADGDQIVYRHDPRAKETHQLWRVAPGATEPVLLTDGASRNGVPAVSARSGRLAFDSNRRNGKDRDLYVVDPMDPGSSRMVTEVNGSWEVKAWAPDDRSILAFEMLPGNDTAIWRIDVASGRRSRLTPPEPATWTDPHYAPDATAVYAISDLGSELPRAWRWRADTWSPITRDGDSVEAIALSPDGKTLAISFDRDASSRIELLDTTTLKSRLVSELPAGQLAPPGSPRGIWNLQWHRDGSELAFTFGSVRTMADVFSVNAGTGRVTRWTESRVGGVDPATLPEPEIVRWKSFDGRMISGVLYRPPARFTGPRPVMINIHGGPNDVRERPRFQGRSAYFLNELGIAIVYPNVRGSFGFGRSFEKLDDGMQREDAVRDIGALLDWIGAQSSLDTKRVMVTGASYGGYMTYAVAQRYPDRIRCALAGAAISDFVTYLESTEPGRQEDRRAEYGDERDPKIRAFLSRISPLAQAAAIRVPLMIAHGRQDARVPVAQAESMFRAVAGNQVPVWLAIYEDEGHENFPRSRDHGNFNFYSWILFVETFLLQ